MPRDIPVGNGNLLVAFDKDYLLRDFYFPHVGEENHTKLEPFRFGVWVDGKFSWLPHGWEIHKDYLNDSLVTNVLLINEELNLRIISHDLVDFHENIYLRKMTVENTAEKAVEVKIFFGHDFYIYGNDIGDTAAFRPEVEGLLHYKKDRYFLINVFANDHYGIWEFATGIKNRDQFAGTWKDAEDGVLSNNPIAQGSVDSVLAVSLLLNPKEKKTFYYWIAVGKNWEEVKQLNDLVKKKTPERIYKRTYDYWKFWVGHQEQEDPALPHKVSRLYKRSLLICRSQIDNCGSIMAANDSDAVYFNRDTYSYMWPRDGALIAWAFDLAGYYGSTRKFYQFCAKIIEKDGYFLHKYNPSGSVASSWHPWQRKNKLELPIQEDETALIINSLWNHYRIYRDVEFILPLYLPLIKNAADFMMRYRDPRTGLPLESYDLWEERRGVLTFTCSAVYAGLLAAAHFAEAFGETDLAEHYRKGAQEIHLGMDKYLYLPKEERFARMINFKDDGTIEVDATIDASLYAIWDFGAYDVRDPKVENTMRQVKQALWCNTPIGGLARYPNDYYYRVSNDVPGNPWFITTLWLARYEIARAEKKEDLAKAMELLEWTAAHARPSGTLAEQVHPHTGEPLSVSPLTWSHGTFVSTVQSYLMKLSDLEKCQTCGQPKLSSNRFQIHLLNLE